MKIFFLVFFEILEQQTEIFFRFEHWFYSPKNCAAEWAIFRNLSWNFPKKTFLRILKTKILFFILENTKCQHVKWYLWLFSDVILFLEDFFLKRFKLKSIENNSKLYFIKLLFYLFFLVRIFWIMFLMQWIVSCIIILIWQI